MKSKEKIISLIQSMTGKYSAYTIFRDWVEMSAISIQNGCSMFHDKLWGKREEQYFSIINRYDKEEQFNLAEMFYLLSMSLEENIEDVLGDVYMRSGCYSKELGQFFTPFHLANLMSEMSIDEGINNDSAIVVMEPSTGGGANIIALAKSLNDRGINYQNVLTVVAQDLDWLAVYMSYVQFSLLGISAEVVQGDTLCDPYVRGIYSPEHVFITPKRAGALI